MATNDFKKIACFTDLKIQACKMFRALATGCIEGALMASQLRYNFQASQAVHSADDL